MWALAEIFAVFEQLARSYDARIADCSPASMAPMRLRNPRNSF
jgi:hypothetical protein